MLAAYKQIDPTLSIGTTTQQAFTAQVAQSHDVQAQIAELELQLINLRNRRDDQIAAIWEVVKRARATIKGLYGDDSSEYELLGGTRMSERKKTSRRSDPPTPSA